jgi:hypothetical protein
MPTFNNTIVATRVKEMTLAENLSGELQSGYVTPENQLRITRTGASFGTAPTVILFGDWADKTPGGTSALDDLIVGEWTQGHYGSGLLSKYFEAFGQTGISLREGGTDEDTDNRLTGFVKNFTATKNLFIYHEMAVPAGRTFPGASTTETMPAFSSSKPCWPSKNPLDDLAQPDTVIGSWTTANFNFVGNECPYNLSMGSSFDFAGWNGFSGYQIAGTDPQFDFGEMRASKTNASGTVVTTITNKPAFRRQSTILVTTAANNTLYSVTINGEDASYTSDNTNQTAAQIATQIGDAIIASGEPVSKRVVGARVQIWPNDLQVDFTCIVGANMTVTEAIPEIDHISFPAWSGNGNQDLAQQVFSRFYAAVSTDDAVRRRVELVNISTAEDYGTAAMTVCRPCNFDSWTADDIYFTPSAAAKVGATHMCVVDGNTVLELVELP